jgi:hypothetical protein
MPGAQKVMPGMPKQLAPVLVATAAVILIAAQSLGFFHRGSLALISPWPFVLIIPTVFGVPPWSMPLVWGAVFVGWYPALIWGAAEVPSRTVALWLATTILSISYFVASWRAGLTFQGPPYTVLVLAVDIVAFSICSALLWHARHKPSFGRCLRLQVSLFVWISTYAFPYLGSGVIG